jgi:proline racemase
MQRISVIDSHTAGEPTRVVVAGGPEFGRGSMADRCACFREHHDAFRSAVVCEPRGSDVMVGALLCEPEDSSHTAGVIFFNNIGCLGMCGHGTMGLVATLARLGRIGPGQHRIETVVGLVSVTLHEDRSISVDNVPSHRAAGDLIVNVDGLGEVRGDVAWGGNWFFLTERAPGTLVLENAPALTSAASAIRRAVNAAGIPQVDHIEFYAASPNRGVHARNFVLCPGSAWDRSPCGTGTSAKLACLAADGALAEREPWVQESILGSRFTGSYRWLDEAKGIIAPTITGEAFITAEATLLLDPRDPFRHGIASSE